MNTTTTFFPVTALLLGIGGCSAQPQQAFIDSTSAQSRPAATAGDAKEAPDGRPEVRTRRVWPSFDAGFYAASISPDGRYLSMIDWSTGNLAVRDLKTGHLHPLSNVRNEEGKPFEWAGTSVFSPDGSKIVVAWTYGKDVQLRMIDFVPDEAGVPRVTEGRVIFDNREFAPYFPFDWSPDGGQLLAEVYPSDVAAPANQLALISTTDGTYRALRSFDWREPLRAEFSPDGRFVAYDFRPDVDSPDRDLFVLSVDGTYEARIAPDPAFDRLLGWLPDGSILFASERGVTPGVWRVPMAEGRPTGSAELVKAEMFGVEPIGFGGNGVYYGVLVDPARLYTASVDWSTGRLASPPDVIGDLSRLRIAGWEWSPDGRLLAYSASSPGAQGSMIGIRSAAGDELPTIHLDLQPAAEMRWNPDGRSLVVAARDKKGRRGFHRIDLETGSASAILVTDVLDEPTWRSNFELSPDGGTLYFARSRELGPPGTLVAYDIASGTDRVVLPSVTDMYGNVAISPDGAQLAFVTKPTSTNPGVVSTVPVTGGPLMRVADLLPTLLFIWGLEWTPDGESIIVVASERVDLTRQLWIVPAAGGAARKIELTDSAGGHPFLFRGGASPVRLHPDGRQVGFLAGTGRGEVWVMEGLVHGTALSATGESK